MSGKTTLQVSKEFAENLRSEHEGHNDEERLQNWAENSSAVKAEDQVDFGDVKLAVREVLEDASIDQVTGELKIQ